MELLVFIGIIVVVFLISNFRKEFFPNRHEAYEDAMRGAYNSKMEEINLRMKIVEHAKRIKSQELMDMAQNLALSYNSLQKIAKKHKIK